MRAVALALLLAVQPAISADTVAHEYVDLLATVREHMERVVAVLPGYTCTETVTRRTYWRGHLGLIDRVRLEVAVVGGDEIFSWPGAATFEQYHPSSLIGGSITTGEYSGLLRAVFLSDDVSYASGVPDVLAGRSLVRFDYRVPEPAYTLIVGEARQKLPFEGSFWVDPRDGRVVALAMLVAETPEELDISTVHNVVEFAPMQGRDEFPFPAVADVVAEYRGSGDEVRNHIVFENCRRFEAESRLSFTDPGERPTAAARREPASLPEGLKIELALENAIGISSAAGDRVSAVLTRPVRAGAVAIPAGARLTGRILRSETRFQKTSRGYSVVAFHFHSLEAGGVTYGFRARPLESQRLKQVVDERQMRGTWITPRDLRGFGRDGSNAARFRLTGQSEIPAGFRMIWQTAAAPERPQEK